MGCVAWAIGSWSKEVSCRKNREHLQGAVWMKHVILSIGLAGILAWPFVAILGLPYAAWKLVNNDAISAIKFSLLYASVLLTIIIVVDSVIYGSWPTIVTWNMIHYNVFRNQSFLYGTESWVYYLKNLILNWNFLIFLSFPGSVFAFFTRGKYPSIFGCSLMSTLWLSVFLKQPHKEERFMSPIYPIIPLLAAVTLCHFKRFLGIILLGIYALVSFLRILAVVHYYGAPLQIDFSTVSGRICLGNDWFLAPGYWHIPSNASFSFVRQDFHGHLPFHFSSNARQTSWGDFLNGVRLEHSEYFNDQNKENKTVYVRVGTNLSGILVVNTM
jgi:alpha-1,2-mannosyltransferase